MVEVGDRIAGKYLLLAHLGQGGMGSVFEARHEELGKKVAIKFLLPELTHDRVGATRFKQEARVAAATGHRSIIDVYDIGETDEGSIFLVMELLKGESMGRSLERQGTISVALASYIVGQVLSALHAAHEHGVVHRDLKPDNVFLLQTGQALPEVKLLDFGAARMVDSTDPADRLTTTGMVLGTPFYMAPEQARGDQELDRRVDVYAAGVLLYESLTGVVPFRAGSLLAVLNRIIEAPLVPPREHDPTIPAGLDALICRALAKDRAERFPTATAMLEALLPFMDAQGSSRISLPTGLHRPPLAGATSTEAEDAASPPPAPPADQRAAALDEEPVPRAPRPARWALKLLGGAVALVALVGGAVIFSGSLGAPRERPPPGELGAVSPPAVDPAPTVEDDAEAALVLVRLAGVPPGAVILLDGERQAGAELRLRRSDGPRELVVTMVGARDWRRRIEPSGDQELTVELEPEPPPRGDPGPRAARAAPADRAGPRQPPVTRADPAAPPAVPPPGAEPEPVGRFAL
jgi:serine/threonine protein kinase